MFKIKFLAQIVQKVSPERTDVTVTLPIHIHADVNLHRTNDKLLLHVTDC